MQIPVFFKRYFELTFWLGALALMAFTSPETNAHYTLCLFKLAGISFCPGCGLGHAMSYLLHGDLNASFSSHPLGVFALLIISHRIYSLTQLSLSSKK